MPPIVSLLISLALVGFLVWVLVTYVPMPELFRRLLVVVVLIVVIVWLLRWIGLFA